MKALTIGGATIDTIAIIDSDRIERMAMSNADRSFLLLEEGGKTEAQEISIHCGGGGVNAAVAMSRLGLDVSTLVKLGTDARADQLMSRLTAEGVSTRWVHRDRRAPTGSSVLVSSHDSNAAIFTFRGANTLMESADLTEEAFAADVVYVANLSNKSAEVFPDVLKFAKKNGAIVATNPGTRQLSAYVKSFEDNIQLIDILTINRHEAETLLPSLVASVGEGGPALPVIDGQAQPALAARGLTGGGFDMSLSRFFGTLTEKGIKHVVLTDGSRGAFVATADEILYCPACKCSVVGTAGAGDAFAATYTAYVAMGRPDDQALQAATINAASVVGHVDTQTGLMQSDDLEAALREAAQSLAVRRWPL